MKTKLFVTLIGVIFFLGCKNNEEPHNKLFDENAKISIYPERKIVPKSTYDGISTYEDSIKTIFKMRAKDIAWRFISEYDNGEYEKSIFDDNIDTINYRFIWKGNDVVLKISEVTHEIILGELVRQAKNIILVDLRKWILYREADTLGYIPNSVVLEARKKITEAFNRQDYEECYRLFDNAYKFRPITGEAYRRLQEQGLN